jgi:hypothetical protein
MMENRFLLIRYFAMFSFATSRGTLCTTKEETTAVHKGNYSIMHLRMFLRNHLGEILVSLDCSRMFLRMPII